MKPRNDRGQATRRRIILVATGLFAERGYEQASIEAVLQATGLSRGALYHHFEGKEALFTAVLEAAEARIAEAVAAAAAVATDPAAVLRAGCAAWLDLAHRDPVVRRVVLVDAPAVVGWQSWREMDSRYALGLVKNVLGVAAASGRFRVEMVDIYAHMLLAVLIEMALLIARSGDRAIAARDGQEAIDGLIAGIFGAVPMP